MSGVADRRTGFTLLELLLVLALAATVLALVLPAVQGPLRRQRLIAAAGELRVELGRVRNDAVRQGRMYTMSLEVEGNRFNALPYDAAGSSGPMSEASLSATSMAGAAEFDDASQSAGVIRSGKLPEGIVFESVDVVLDDASPSADEPADAPQLYFFPDGTTSDALIVLRSERDRAVSVTLRGITGTSLLGQPYLSTQVDR